MQGEKNKMRKHFLFVPILKLQKHLISPFFSSIFSKIHIETVKTKENMYLVFQVRILKQSEIKMSFL